MEVVVFCLFQCLELDREMVEARALGGILLCFFGSLLNYIRLKA